MYTMPVLGSVQMPPNFKYKSAYLKGRPQHQKYDDFRRRHPSMACSRRAKIFSPFDALAGFEELIQKTY